MPDLLQRDKLESALSSFRNLKTTFSISAKDKAANYAISWMVRLVKPLEMRVFLVACISFQLFVIKLVNTFARHFSSLMVTFCSLFAFSGPPFTLPR